MQTYTFRSLRFWIALALAVVCIGQAARDLAAKGRAKKQQAFKTAPPPKFKDDEVATFFDDALSKLGPGQPGAVVVAAASSAPGGVSEEGGAAVASNAAWSKLISASTIEDEIKALKEPLAEKTKTPSEFKSGGNTPARVAFTELALLFGIISEYDGDVRWKKDALGLREIYKHAAGNSKTGSDNSYKEAKQRTDDLMQLIGGGKVDLPKPDPDSKWADIANRAPLMQRMGKEGYDPKIKAWTSDKGEFSKNRNALLEEAQIVAAIAHVIQDASYEYGDDDTYLEYARELEKHSLELVEAIKGDNLERAQSAGGQLNKACSTCHEGYRSGG